MTAPIPTNPFRGMSPEDAERAKAYVANQRAIHARRQAAAMALLAPPGPAAAVKALWGPVKDAIDARKDAGRRDDLQDDRGAPGSVPKC